MNLARSHAIRIMMLRSIVDLIDVERPISFSFRSPSIRAPLVSTICFSSAAENHQWDMPDRASAR